MLSEAIIRTAGPGDSEAITALMREIASKEVRRITILGSQYLARFIADELAENKNDEYVMCTVRERVVGMCGWRHTDTALHLNHISVAPDMHGQGLGAALMLDGLRRIRRASQHKLSTDVFFRHSPHSSVVSLLEHVFRKAFSLDSVTAPPVEIRWRASLDDFLA